MSAVLVKRLFSHSKHSFCTLNSTTTTNTKSMVIALGGNAIKAPSDSGTSAEMFVRVNNATNHILNIVKSNPTINYNLCITHGNGPQIGSLYLQNQLCTDTTPALPLSFCGAMTQGYIGYMLQQSFENNIKNNSNLLKEKFAGVVTMVNQVGISKYDKAFANPSKPIGKFYSETEAQTLSDQNGYTMKEDSGRGWRMTVGSPTPLKIIELAPIKQLLDSQYIVIAGGGGGIPTVIDGMDTDYYGMDAVIDKDKTSVLLAKELHSQLLIIATDGNGIWLNYSDKINRKKLDSIEVTELRQYSEKGMWSKFGGSMQPKIESVIQFVEETGNDAIICDLESIDKAVMGESGTTIYNKQYNRETK